MSDLTLDTAAVEAWLRGRLPGFEGPVEAQKFDAGQSNPTYLLKTPARDYVLRRKPPGKLLKSAHAVDREFRVQRALADTEVPVPRVHVLCEDDSVIGAMFYVMDHVPGRNFATPDLPGLTPAERGAVMDEMGRVLAALHEVDLAAVGLEDYGPKGSYYDRQIGRWSQQYRASELEPIADMDSLIAAMETGGPQDDGQRTLVHGDYRLDNLIFDAETTDCRAVLDWELSTIGHPFADLAAVVMQWRLPPGREGRGLAGLDRAALGLPADEAFIAAYCARRGMEPVADFRPYLAFAFFRMGAILQGVAKRAEEGNASNPEKGRALGAYVPKFARLGLDALEGRA